LSLSLPKAFTWFITLGLLLLFFKAINSFRVNKFQLLGLLPGWTSVYPRATIGIPYVTRRGSRTKRKDYFGWCSCNQNSIRSALAVAATSTGPTKSNFSIISGFGSHEENYTVVDSKMETIGIGSVILGLACPLVGKGRKTKRLLYIFWLD